MQKIFHKLFYYKDGKIFNRYKRGRNALADIESGTLHKNKWATYRACIYKGKSYLSHRIIYIMHHGNIPDGMEIDHIDGDGLNNKIENLRIVTRNMNQRNRKNGSNNTSGNIGVFWHKHKKKWEVHIGVDKKLNYLGAYDDKDEAISVSKNFRSKHGFTDRHGC